MATEYKPILEKGKVNIILDLFWGSSAKGLMSSFVALKERPDIIISTNRMNACLTKGHLVFTDQGLVPIEDIGRFKMRSLTNANDTQNAKAYNKDNYFGAVSKVFDVGDREVLKIVLKNGQEIESTHNHQFFIWDSSDEQMKWVRADELDPFVHQFTLKKEFPDFVSEYKTVLVSKSDDPNANNINKESIVIDEDIGYLFGILCGDGAYSSVSKGRIQIAFADNNILSAEKIRKILLEKFDVNTGELRNGTTASFSIGIGSVSFHKFLFDAGFDLVTGEKKGVPSSILQSPKSVIRAFIAGLVESDGSITTSNGARITVLSNISQKMCQQTQVLLSYLGINSKIDKQSAISVARRNERENTNRKTVCRVCVSSANGVSLFKEQIKLADKQTKLDELFNIASEKKGIFDCTIKTSGDMGVRNTSDHNYDNDYYYVDIVSVEHNGVKPVFDLTEDSTHSYYCNGWISHNSHTLSYQGEEFVFKILPTSAGLCRFDETYRPLVFIGATAGFEIEQLRKEIEWCKLSPDRVVIHPRAMVVQPHHVEAEQNGATKTEHLGSTMSGSGSIFAEKIMRGVDTKLAYHYAEELADCCIVVPDDQANNIPLRMAGMLEDGFTAFAELSQGFPLSLDHSVSYHHSTSRNVLPTQMMSDLGLAHIYLGSIIANVRSLPIRVSNRFSMEDIVLIDAHGGEHKPLELGLEYNDINPVVEALFINKEPAVLETNQGFKVFKGMTGVRGFSGTVEPDMEELSWKEVAHMAGIPDENYHEKTTLTKLTRRVFGTLNGFAISRSMLFQARASVYPTHFFLTFLNYVDWACNDITSEEGITKPVDEFVRTANEDIQSIYGEDANVSLIQFGKSIENVFPSPFDEKIELVSTPVE